MLNLKEAHDLCKNHKEKIKSSDVCGCFYCMAIFSPLLIKEWIDNYTTALCPNCQIDAVLPQAPELLLNEIFLEEMHKHWFSKSFF